MLRSFPLPLLLLPACGLGLLGCRATPYEPRPLRPEAELAMAEARALQRAGSGLDDEVLVGFVERARAAEPGWVVPERMLDDLHVSERLGPEVLERRRAALQGADAGSTELYLAGRLEGEAGLRHFAAAVAADPYSAWARHGLAWAHGGRGEWRQAEELEEAAIRLARSAWERAYFELALARLRFSAGAPEVGLAGLRAARAGLGLEPYERSWFDVELTLAELAQPDLGELRTGYRRGLELIREEPLPRAELERLVEALRDSLAGVDLASYQLELALAAQPTPAREQLRAELLAERRPGEYALRVFDSVHADSGAAAAGLSRLALFAVGRFGRALDVWLAGLPAQVLGKDGLPRDAALRRVVTSARSVGAGSDEQRARATFQLVEALLDAGWFPEARRAAEHAAAWDLERARVLRDRALAGSVLTRSILDVLRGRDPLGSPPDLPDAPLDRVLVRLARHFAAAHRLLGGEAEPAVVERELLATPRLDYGPFAVLLHPGRDYSAADEAAGLGVQGSPVGGLAAEMARIGRFGLVGKAFGGPVDSVVLRCLLVEERSGEHLGVPWRGTIAWCDGSDTPDRLTNGGTRISGAALHEGYWIDLSSVRQDLAAWRGLEEEYAGETGRARLERVLASGGLPLRGGLDDDQRSAARCRLTPLLGEEDRIRLAVLADRAPADGSAPLGSVTFTELVECVAVHEEGHLCDRTLYLPLSDHLPRVLALLLRAGVSPRNVQGLLEYRAQLVALCEVADPRVPLAEVVTAAGATERSVLPHAEAYRELLAELLQVLDRRLAREPEAWPALRGDRTLVHQLHRLGPEEVRSLARDLARREGVGRW